MDMWKNSAIARAECLCNYAMTSVHLYVMILTKRERKDCVRVTANKDNKTNAQRE